MNEISHYRTLIDAVSFRSERDPKGRACVFLSEDGRSLDVDNGRLYDDMKRCALRLRDGGIGPGDIVLLALDHGYGLVRHFWGAVRCGAVPSVMTYWRAGSDQGAYAGRIGRLAAAVRARAVITLPDLLPAFTAAFSNMDCLVVGAREPADDRDGTDGSLPAIDPGQIALMQFTSGTTGAPKAVRFSHRAVLDHIAASVSAYGMTGDWVYVSWLPFYHDMGMIGHIRSLAYGDLLVSMSPRDWLSRPEMLFRAVHAYRGTLTNMPNFGFDYCTRRVRDEDLAGIDLSSWRVLTNGAEPVLTESMRRFAERFAAYGLRPNVFAVGYGMAENVCGITMTPPGEPLSVDWVSAEDLHARRRAVPAGPGSAGARAVTGCGYPFRGTDIAILDDRGESLPEREVGEIAVRSGTLFSGYYLAPEAAEGAFHDGWFRTGDVGYVAAGQLFVCDRKKDLIISGGRNLHPRAIESIAEAVFGESAGRCAAFGVADPVLGTEVPVLVIEKRRDMDGAAEERMLLRVRQSVFRDLELVLADVRIVPRGWLVKTTSGKLARAASREKYIAQGYDHASGGFPFSPDDLAPERLTQTAARLFEMVIGIGGVGPDDDFIRLGGDSLSALRLFAEVEKLFGMRISTMEFFRRPTARHLADILRRGADGVPSGEAGMQQQLTGEGPQPGPGIDREAPLPDPDDDIRESSLAGMKPPGCAYRLRLRLMTRLLGHEWAQRMFRPSHSSLIRRFHALVDGPAQSEREAVRCGLICDSPGRFQDDLLNQIVSHGPGCWSLNADMASLERAHREGRGVILAGRHAGLALLIREFTLDRLKPNGYFFIKMVPGMIPGESAVPPGPERKRLRLSFFMDQLMQAKRVLSGGGVVFVLPDGGAGLSRGVSLPFHGRMRNFKTGFAELAVETGAPVVPVSMGIDVLAREVTLAFCEPMDIGPADLPHAERVEGLVRQYAAYLDEEWKRFPGSVALKQKEAHLKMRPAGR